MIFISKIAVYLELLASIHFSNVSTTNSLPLEFKIPNLKRDDPIHCFFTHFLMSLVVVVI